MSSPGTGTAPMTSSQPSAAPASDRCRRENSQPIEGAIASSAMTPPRSGVTGPWAGMPARHWEWRSVRSKRG